MPRIIEYIRVSFRNEQPVPIKIYQKKGLVYAISLFRKMIVLAKIIEYCVLH